MVVDRNLVASPTEQIHDAQLLGLPDARIVEADNVGLGPRRPEMGRHEGRDAGLPGSGRRPGRRGVHARAGRIHTLEWACRCSCELETSDWSGTVTSATTGRSPLRAGPRLRSARPHRTPRPVPEISTRSLPRPDRSGRTPYLAWSSAAKFPYTASTITRPAAMGEVACRRAKLWLSRTPS